MAGSLPSSIVEGIDLHIRNIEKARVLRCAIVEHKMPALDVQRKYGLQVAGETSASQASLLKQLSELEQGMQVCQ